MNKLQDFAVLCIRRCAHCGSLEGKRQLWMLFVDPGGYLRMSFCDECLNELKILQLEAGYVTAQ